MRTPICDQLGCEVPIFAFSHSGAVVAAVSRAGGFGVLGASTFSPERFTKELDWIDERIGGRPYGVDVVIPSTYSAEAEASQEELQRLIPDAQRAFVDGLLAEYGVPELDPRERDRLRAGLAAGRGGMTPQGAISLVRTASHHEQVRLVVSALGILPPDVIAELHSRDVIVGAMCGKARHAEKQIAAGAQLVVAQGTEAGGHSGEISTMVLVPEIVERVGEQATVLAAGGIARGSQIVAAMAMGAQGVWCGTIWLGTSESELDDLPPVTRRCAARRARARPCG
jgi:NAD(P)H-dependent flavin oxidoreductase YrpB (nitropropane dioxygenase family)